MGIIISVKLDFTSLLKADNEVNTPIKVSEEMLSLQKAFTDIAEKVDPAVVWIGTEQTIKSKNYGNDFDDLFRRFFVMKIQENNLSKKNINNVGLAQEL